MNYLSLQDLIKKVFMDENTKKQFLHNPEEALRQQNITDEEMQATLKVHARLGLVTSSSQQLETNIDSLSDWHAPEW